MLKYVENEGDTRVQEERLRIQNGGLLRGGYDIGRDGRGGLNLLLCS